MAEKSNQWASKEWRDAIRIAVNEDDTAKGRKRLRVLADKLVALAADGDVGALKEIGDRLDGKAQQSHEVSGTLGMGLTINVKLD